MVKSILNLIISFSLSFVVQSQNTSNLELVHVFFRHGSRTPELHHAYPSDPYKEEAFQPTGYGQLTNRGKYMAYQLGQRLHNRYHDFLGDIYTPDVVKAFSTDFDRTKMTVLLVLAGLFPPSSSQKWNEDLPWLPIPYHFDKDNIDYTLRRPTKYCPTYVRKLEEVLASSDVQRDLKTYKKLFQYISKQTKQSMTKLSDLFGLYQTLNAEDYMNLTLPEWTKTVYPDQLHLIAGKQCDYENYTPILKKLNGGRMLSKVIENMKLKSTNSLTPSGRKIFLYSGHENNVINILAALNLFQPHVPKYSSAVIIELHSINGGTDYAVKIIYSKDADTEPETLKLEGCDTLCPLGTFIQITAPHVPVNYTLECDSLVNLD